MMRRWRRADRRPVPPPLATPACRALVVPLALGVGLLCVCLCLSGTAYLKPEPVATDGPEGEGEGEAPPQDSAQLVRVPIIALEAQGALADETPQSAVESARQRVAANILIRSGYLAQFSVSTATQTGLPDMRGLLNGAISGCAWVGDVDGISGEDVARDAIGVVAVEKFNRSGAQRRLEWWASKLLLTLTGRLPDFSIGPAQIRPSVVRRVAASRGVPESLKELAVASDAQLLDHLMDECRAVGTAAALLQHWRATLHSGEAAIRTYGGQRRETQAVIDYVPVVQSISALIRG
jgi:hypothetical protein